MNFGLLLCMMGAALLVDVPEGPGARVWGDQEWRDDEVRARGCKRCPEENNAGDQQWRVDVVTAVAAARLLDDHWNQKIICLQAFPHRRQP
mgnify:CR=1 FL=1